MHFFDRDPGDSQQVVLKGTALEKDMNPQTFGAETFVELPVTQGVVPDQRQ